MKVQVKAVGARVLRGAAGGKEGGTGGMEERKKEGLRERERL